MKRLAVLVLLAACELQPAPKQQPTSAAPVVPPAPPAERAPEPPRAPADAGVAPADAGEPALAISGPCMEVATHLAQVFIDKARDPALKLRLEQEHANMTRKMGAACTTQAWSDAARACYLAATQETAIRACEKKFTPKPPPRTPPRPAPAAGSAATPGAANDMRREPGAPAR